MYLNEFVNAKGEKFGWATKIEGSNIFNGSFNAETSTILKQGLAYEFEMEDGYGLYFMMAYATAVNDVISNSNGMLFRELYDERGYNFYITPDSELTYDVTLNTSTFTTYKKFNETNGIYNEKYPTYAFVLHKPGYGQNFDAAKKIADNLHGLWKVNTPSFMGSINPGRSGAYMAELITCWYGPFDDYGATEPGIDDVIKNSDGYKARQLIDYKPLTPKKVN